MRVDRRAAGHALVALSVAAIVAALWQIGGPGQAQAERRDATRMQDLQALARHIQCRHRTGADPATEPAATIDCPLPDRLADPYTGATYVIGEVQDGEVALCAGFELASPPEPRWMRVQFDPDTGCLRVPLAGGDPPAR